MQCNVIRHEIYSDEKEGQAMDSASGSLFARARSAAARWRKHICVFPAAIIATCPGADVQDVKLC